MFSVEVLTVAAPPPVASTVPRVSATTPNPATGNVNTGGSVAITLTMSEVVFVTGTPQLVLNSGGIAAYASGSGTASLVFNYSVSSGDTANPLAISSTNLNGGTILDGATNAANLSAALVTFTGLTINSGSGAHLVANIPLGNFIMPTTAGAVNGAYSTNADTTTGFAANQYSVLTYYWNGAPSDDVYTFIFDAYWTTNIGYPGNSIEFLVDGANCLANSGSSRSYWMNFVNNPSPSQGWSFTAPVLAGPHYLHIRMNTCQTPAGIGTCGLHVERLRIFSTGTGIPADGTPATRDPYQYPFRSDSFWNTSIANTAVASLSTDADTVQLRGCVTGIKSGTFAVAAFQGQSTDPIGSWTNSDTGITTPLLGFTGLPNNTKSLRIPVNAAGSPGAGTDRAMLLSDATNARYLYGTNQTSTSQTSPNVVSGNAALADSYTPNSYYTDQSGAAAGAGLIRFREVVTDGVIAHVMFGGLSTDREKSGDTTRTNIAWPTVGEDFGGPPGGATPFTGQILYGSTIYLPASVNINSFGLNANGLMFARAMQDYGMIINVSSPGQFNFIFGIAEDALAGTQQLTDMSNAFGTIRSQLVIMRNQSPTSIQGLTAGGTRRQPPRPGLLPISGFPAINFAPPPLSPSVPFKIAAAAYHLASGASLLTTRDTPLGSLIVVLINNNAAVTSVTDAAGNTYQQAVASAITAPNTSGAAIWYSLNTQHDLPANNSITVNGPSNWNGIAYAAASAQGGLDKTIASISTTGVTSISLPLGSVSQANELCFGIITAPTGGTSYVAAGEQFNGSSSPGLWDEQFYLGSYLITGSIQTVTYNPFWSSSNPAAYAAAACSFRIP
jgi:hypothetical protein